MNSTTDRRGFLRTCAAGAAGALLAGSASCSTADRSGADDTLSFTSWGFAETRSSTAMREACEVYTESTGLTVDERVYPYDKYLNQLVLSARGGRMTGIVHIDEEWMSALATAEVIKDLNPHVDTALYPRVVDKAGSYDGVRYAMPWTQSALGIVTNGPMLRDLGIDTSTFDDIDGFTRALRRIKDSDGSLIPYAPCSAVTQLKDFIPWIWAFGGTVYESGEVTLGDPGSKDALDYWKMLLDDGLIQAGMDREGARTLFAQQRTAIYDDAPQAIGVIPPQSSDPDIASKMEVVRRPARDGEGHNLIWSQPLVALDDSEATVEALRIFSTDLRTQQIAFEGLGNPPTTIEAIESPWFAEDSFHEQWNRVVVASARRNPLWDFPIGSSAQRAHDEAIEQGLRGTVSSTQALKEGKEALIELLRG